ncbi:uncharacterized protein PHACADRAFT_125251 [Phanerochaete carnosa HHB-10118-sp]|uniref:Major facilitator superfamily (MFS) profile domain-containing protein n=1 Tax=Phanerochaete carnosa (strain HHB-10118-sp) TaxID=650164 RepID=K5W2X6_PHACS|nr:uncharacterized protein PHACADRAFT_125251 [Phanerochaete carnosa HHB-10118-sp]EKM53480.1 hypothetical protein PHACADRAFT_125251 [Phanerochaete carnosa HHB-10118-sp]
MPDEKSVALSASGTRDPATPSPTLSPCALGEGTEGCRCHDFFFLPIPSRLRYDPSKPPQLTLALNIMFAATTTIFVSTLYYCQPMLIELAQSFDVSYNRVSNIPTLMQAGYAAGLLLIAPLGDLVYRRPLILLLGATTSALMLGSAFTMNFIVFEVISVFAGMFSCVSQILAPLTADLAAPERRASALSILIAGVLLGIMCARIVAGIIAEYASWRVVYYVAGGLQGATVLALYFVLPDYPVKNKGLSYWSILFSMAKYCVTEPQLIQAALVSMVSMACFSNFWVTLTFLLDGPPYYYSTLVIGLFGLVGVFGIVLAPFVGRAIDRLLLPWTSAVVATVGLLVFQGIQTGAGGINIAAVVIVCFGIDVFRQFQQVSLNTIIFDIEPSARSRMNSVVQLSVFVGQIMGTAVGTEVFLKDGWRPAAALSVGWSGFTLIVLLLRGPYCKRYTWFGYDGGRGLRKSKTTCGEKDEPDAKANSSEVNTRVGSREYVVTLEDKVLDV